jgi:hypothetical protein
MFKKALFEACIAALAFPLAFGLMFGFTGIGDIPDAGKILIIYGVSCALAMIVADRLTQVWMKEPSILRAVIADAGALAVFLFAYGMLAWYAGKTPAELVGYLVMAALPATAAIVSATMSVALVWTIFPLPISPPQANLTSKD